MSSDSLNIIVAVADDNAIGRDGNQPFFVSADLKHFKALTMGHPIIMGRRTFEALPKGALPGRRNIVVTRTQGYKAEGAELAGSIEDAFRLVEGAGDAFVIGGASIYAQALPFASRLYITRIYARAEGVDTFFPEIGTDWQSVKCDEISHDEKSGLYYRFEVMERMSR